ncbi:MAG: PAS domain S-box protein [Planctomycetes bacterium]|nr:PAS domain S-box protein [Planctomycetota bacterium]
MGNDVPQLGATADSAGEETRLALVERIKELNCLYALGKLGRAERPLAETLHKAVEIIPHGWQYPEITCAHIIVEGEEFKSRRFEATAWKQSSDILVRDRLAGAVTVYYLEERPERDQGSFLKEGRNLIDEIAGELGLLIERKENERKIKDLARFPAENPSPVLRVAGDGTVLYANEAAMPLLRSRGSDVGKTAPAEWHQCILKALPSGRPEMIEVEHEGRIFSFAVVPVSVAGYVNLYGRDITEHKRAEEETISLLKLVRTGSDAHQLFKKLIRFLHRMSGCQAVGIRLSEGDDYPYYETKGFPEEFVLAENKLCATDENGDLLRDSDGRPLLECMCGNVIRGRFDPSMPFFTEHGSFWTNSTTKLLAGTSEADRGARTRNRCNTAGYESVALIPLRHGGETLGLLQFNDERKGRFTPQLIGLFERLAGNVALAVAQRRSEEALRESERRFRRLFDESPIGAAIVSLDYRYQKINATLCEITGYSEDELIGRKPADVTHPDDVNIGIQETARLIAGEIDRYQIDKRYIRKDGKIVWVRLFIRAVRDADGRMLYYLPVIQDISAQKRAEYLLENFTESVMDTVPAMIVTIDSNSEIQRFNRFARELTGYTHEEVRRDGGLERIVGPEEGEHVFDKMQRTLEGSPDQGMEVSIRTKDGRKLLTRWNGSALHDDRGNVVGAVAIGVDITELRQKEEQLYHAAKMEAIGRLAGGVAHDFNNYLAAVKGYAHLILQEISTEDAHRDLVEEIAKAADGAAELTKQLLAFGRKAVVAPRVINLNSLLNEMTDSLKVMLGENIILTVRQGRDLGSIKADPGHASQIIMNLAINARDAMPKGGLLTIETANAGCHLPASADHRQAPLGTRVVLTVSDTGAGMDEQTRAQIFEPFFTTKPNGKGTGLGLATVYGIVEQIGGHITVKSDPGHGTTFSIWFPCAKGKEEVPKPPASREQPKGGGETILVVEDEEPVRRFLVRALGRSGYDVLDAAGPTEALMIEQNHKERIHLLISDVIMPEMNGPQLAEKLRATRPELPVLYVSGYTRDAIPDAGIAQTEVELLTKPFTPDQLNHRVRQALDAVAAGS